MKLKTQFFAMFVVIAAISATVFTGCSKDSSDPAVVVTGVALDQTSLELAVGDSKTLAATIAPDNAANKTVTWTTSDNSKATVVDGFVTAVAAGSVTITAKAGDKTSTCAITVTNIYVAGYDGDKAVIWKNGVQSVLGDGSVWELHASGNNLYALGDLRSGDAYVATVWRNNVSLNHNYTDNISYCALSGDNFYAVGSVYDYQTFKSTIVLWKNGVKQSFNGEGYPAGIAVAGNDVLILAGKYANGSSSAWLYRNGVPTEITASQGQVNANAIAVKGTDVYISGSISDANFVAKAALWKNGVLQTLAATGSESNAYCIRIYGDDVWLAGYVEENGVSKARIWKNGALHSDLPAPAGKDAKISSFCIVGDALYVSGYLHDNNGERVAMWKNGELQNLPSTSTQRSGGVAIASSGF